MGRRRALVATCLTLLLQGCSRPAPPSVVLISVDTLRADHVGAFGGPAGLTPAIDRLAGDSVVFRRAYSPASFTLPAVSALMTSRYPEELGVRENGGRMSPQAVPLAGWLRQQGFGTAAVVSNYVLRREHGLHAGFDSYDAEFPQTEASRGVPERTGPDTTAAALKAADALKAAGKPSLLWVHYQDPHGPYTPPPGQRPRAVAGGAPEELPVSATQSGLRAIPRYQYIEGHSDARWYRDGYRGEVAWVDAAIGRLLEGLDARGMLDDAIVVLTADHGEELGENGYYFTHGENLSDCLLRVPLLIRVPGGRPGVRNDVASLLDVMPTLAGALRLSPPSGLRGRDLLRDTRDGEVFLSSLQAEPLRHGLVSDGHRYVARADGAGESLFALGTETPDVAPRQPELLQRFRGRLAAARRTLVPLPAAGKRELTEEERENFKALGYVDGGG